MKVPSDMEEGVVHSTLVNGDLRIVKYHGALNVDIEFISTGYKTNARSESIRAGKNIKDPLFRSVCGVGFLGIGKHIASIKGVHSKAYLTWKHMLERCYDPKSLCKFPTYLGCYVCEEWHSFQCFADWYIKNKPENDRGYSLDKDIIEAGNKKYCPEKCTIVLMADNTMEMVKRRMRRVKLMSPSGDVVECFNISEFARNNNLHQSGLNLVVNKKQVRHKGWSLFE